MPHHFHAVVWLDRREARIFEFGGEDIRFQRIRNENAGHIHHKAGSVGAGHAPVEGEYLAAIAKALVPVHEILLTGPAQTKTELTRWLEKHAPEIAERVLGVETLDRFSDGEIVAFARKFFAREDRMTPQIP
ncbi:MAG TPA: hypothetical protein VG889_01980 [Rhizomicrobium sp.]|nr:hypothetical protein [Rhizomicrobium sp.]